MLRSWQARPNTNPLLYALDYLQHTQHELRQINHPVKSLGTVPLV